MKDTVRIGSKTHVRGVKPGDTACGKPIPDGTLVLSEGERLVTCEVCSKKPVFTTDLSREQARKLLEQLTPTEDLVCEILAARVRLGERIWTYDSRLRPTIERLASYGLLMPMNGIVEKTVRASFTAAGEKFCISPTYVPPILAGIASAAEEKKAHEATLVRLGTALAERDALEAELASLRAKKEGS